MMKFLVLGSSHSTCIQRAVEERPEVFSQMDLTFFAMQGPMLLRGRTDATGIFHPHTSNDGQAALLDELNGARTVALRDFDTVLVVGFHARPIDHASLLEGFGLLGDGSAHPPLSVGFVRAILREKAEAWAAELTKRFAGEKNLVFTPAPAPATSIVAREGYEAADSFRDFVRLPIAAQIVEIWEAEVERAVRKWGYGYVAQPAETRAAPYGTHPDYAERAEGGEEILDHRHMNSGYGALVLRDFFQEYLKKAARVA